MDAHAFIFSGHMTEGQRCTLMVLSPLQTRKAFCFLVFAYVAETCYEVLEAALWWQQVKRQEDTRGQHVEP